MWVIEEAVESQDRLNLYSVSSRSYTPGFHTLLGVFFCYSRLIMCLLTWWQSRHTYNTQQPIPVSNVIGKANCLSCPLTAVFEKKIVCTVKVNLQQMMLQRI